MPLAFRRSLRLRISILVALGILGPCLPPQQLHAQAAFGIGLGTEYGFGALLRLGTDQFHLEGGVGFVPVYAWVNVMDDDDILEVYFPAAFGAKASVQTGAGVEIEGGVTSNRLLKVGFGGGINFQPKNSRLLVSAGVMIYPKAEDEIRARINKDKGTDYSEDELTFPLAMLQPYAGLTFLLGRR